MFNKSVQRMRNFNDIPPDSVRTITAPTLIVCGDTDVMRPEHAVQEFRLMPHAQLAVLPRTNHTQVIARTSWLVPMIEDFLDAE
jgi:pimeloyl-ACP methyl ester carboxylesterase